MTAHTFGASLFLVASLAAAQTAVPVTQYVPSGDVPAHADAPVSKWTYNFSFSANAALAQNSNVVGQPEGISLLFGVGLGAGAQYLNGPHDFQVKLSIVESFSKTPALEAFLKANDLARLEALYAYYFTTWLGIFGRLNFESPLLNTFDYRANAVTYSITRQAGGVNLEPNSKSRLLATGLQPLTMNQSLGAIARAFTSEPATLTIRAGGGARETFASGVLVVKDDAATKDIIELVETANVFQGGLEAAAGLVGKIPSLKLEYAVDFGIMFPLLNNDPKKRDVLTLTRVALGASATFGLFSWLGIKYGLLVLRDQQLVEGVQVQNNLFLTFKYDYFSDPKPPPPDPVKVAEEAAKAAEERAKAAEARAVAAEAKLKTLEQPPVEPTPAPAPAPVTP